MKKHLLIAAIAITAMASCSSNDFVGDESPQTSSGNVGAISFTSGTPAITRAIGSDAAGLLNNNFVVFGYKTVNSTPSKVFDNYQVNYVASTAYTTESNSANWEYVGYKNLPYGTGTKENEAITLNNNGVATNATATGIDQSIKYWDFSASFYDFFAYSLGAGDTYGNSWAKASAMSNSTYTLEGDAVQLGTCYISDKINVTPSQNETKVNLNFRSFKSQIELKFYETIPGYSVKALQFYADGDPNTTSVQTPYLFGSSILAGAKYIVTFDNEGKAQLTLSNTAPTYDTRIAFGSLDNYAARDYQEAEAQNTYIGRTSNAATSTDLVPVLPNPQNADALNLKIDFTLVSRDGTGEEINMKGATAVIPAAYAKWQPNYKYTYIFKISDNTNAQSGQITGLYPITLDAVVTDAQNGSQETITTVSDPSITTYAKGTMVTANNEYLTGANIYVVVDKNGTVQTLTTEGNTINAKLYKVTNDTGNGTAQEITEASVANALANGTKDNVQTPTTWTVTGANMKSLIVTTTGVPTLSASTSIATDDSPTGVAIDVNGAKFTPSTAGTYAFEFIDTADSNKKYYKIIKVVAAPAQNP